MATSKTRTIEKTRMVEEQYTEADGVILELTHEEAVMLAYLVGHRICGSGSGRKPFNRIWDALKGSGYAGFGRYTGEVEKASKYFKSGENALKGYIDMKEVF